MAKQDKEQTMSEYILAQLEQPVIVTAVDENGQKVRREATDPNDGHRLTTKEAIAMKLLQNALSGDIKAAQFIMEQERTAKMFELSDAEYHQPGDLQQEQQ